MSKLEKLIESFLKEHKLIPERNVEVVTQDGTKKTAKPDQLKDIKPGDVVKYSNKNDATKTSVSEKKVEEPVEDNSEDIPKEEGGIEALKAELQGTIAKLESMDDFKVGDKEDLKAKKLINKIKLKLDDILLAMDDLGAIKSNLDEQRDVLDGKEADKYEAIITKMLKKRFKNPQDIEGVMNKYRATVRKHKDKDAEKVSEAIVKHMLKEGYKGLI